MGGGECAVGRLRSEVLDLARRSGVHVGQVYRVDASRRTTGSNAYVSGLGSDDIRGSETIFRGNFGFNVRVIGGHALGVRYVSSTRDARYGTLPNKKISEGTFTFAYSFLGPSHFGAVKW